MKVLLALPGKYYSGNFLVCMINFIHNCYHNNIEIMTVQRFNSFLPFCRASTLGANIFSGATQKLFQGNFDVDYVLMIDSDQIFSYDNFIKLINEDKDFISGIYLMNGGKYTSIVENYDNDYFLKHGNYKFITNDEIKQKTEPFKITGYVGLGFCVFKPHILEKIEYPWFAPVVEKFPGGIQELKSEDASFCDKLINAGIDIYIHPQVKVGHEKSIIY